jgi:hypothetical protein
MQSLSQTNAAIPYQMSVYLTAVTFLFPASIMIMSLGNFIIGEEGQAIWRIYSSPVSAKNLVKSKYSFIIFLSLIVLAITGIFGFLIYHPSLRATLVASFETVCLVFALGSISLSNGIRGADFTEAPRPRMIRQSWSLINLGACLLAGIAMLVPFLPYVLSSTLSAFIPSSIGWSALLDPYQALVISAIIAVILAVIFYRVALKNAKELLSKAEI